MCNLDLPDAFVLPVDLISVKKLMFASGRLLYRRSGNCDVTRRFSRDVAARRVGVLRAYACVIGSKS